MIQRGAHLTGNHLRTRVYELECAENPAISNVISVDNAVVDLVCGKLFPLCNIRENVVPAGSAEHEECRETQDTRHDVSIDSSSSKPLDCDVEKKTRDEVHLPGAG